MTYDEIKKLEPRLENFEHDCIEFARQQKRAGTFNADMFFYKHVKPIMCRLVGSESGRPLDDPLMTPEAYDLAYDHFADHPAFEPVPETPKLELRFASGKNAIEREINQFLKQNVCRLISCDVQLSDGIFFATIIYFPY